MANAAVATKQEHPVLAGIEADRGSLRAADSRENNPIHDEDDDAPWNASTLTSAPPARPGFDQRWIRYMTMGAEDIPHLMRKRNEGWEPRHPDTIPNGYFAPITTHASLGNVVCNGDMILMERSSRRGDKQRAAIAQLTKNQTGAVERYLSRNAPGGGGFGPGEVDQFERKVTVGKRPRIADD